MTPAPSVPVREHRDQLTFPSLSTFPCLEQPAGTESPTSRCPQDLRLFARSSRVDVLRPGWAPFRCVLMHRSHGPWLPPPPSHPLRAGSRPRSPTVLPAVPCALRKGPGEKRASSGLRWETLQSLRYLCRGSTPLAGKPQGDSDTRKAWGPAGLLGAECCPKRTGFQAAIPSTPGMSSPGTRRLAAGSTEVRKGRLARGLGGTSAVPPLPGCVSLTRL